MPAEAFPDSKQFRDDLAQISAEVKRHREVEALLPELVAALDLLLTDVEQYEAWQRPCHAVNVASAVLARARELLR